jgi:uncharacterized repeat protein (TIGR01451 family)
MERSRSNNPPTRLRSGIAALGVAMSFAIGTGTVHAAGTASGTSIDNLSTLNYSVGGIAQPAIGSSPTGNTVGAGTATSFVVDNRVNLTVTTTDGTFVSVFPGSTLQVTTFSVANIGNTVQDFSLASAQEANGEVLFGGTDNFDATACAQFAETNGTPGFQSGADTATFLDELAPDTSRTVYVVCSIPAGRVNNDNAVVSLTATALAGGAAGQGAALVETAGANTAGIDIVFGDAAGTDDAARDAAHSSRSAYRVQSAALSVAKVATLICDPFNSQTNPKNIPGAIVRWTITITNTGAASATLGTVADAISASTMFDANLVTGAGGAAGCSSGAGTPESLAGRGFKLDITGDTRTGVWPRFFTTANDADGIELNGVNVTVNFATVMPVDGVTYAAGELKTGESVIVYFNVTVN